MMQAKLKAEFTAKSKPIDDKDVTLLVKAIKGVSHHFDSTINPYVAVDEGKRKWYALHQGQNDSPVDFLTYFKYFVELLEHYGGDIANDTVLINYETTEFKKALDLVALTDDEVNNAILAYDIPTVVKNKLLAVTFLRRADRACYGDLLHDLQRTGRISYHT